ncbi:MAG: ABC-F family ATP-binding cassette domain-containing protein [Clostridia bacterium]|nr:ABC-F family ATP-binding cassette domain-containing protein [Clostridia bacterium]
MILIDVNNLSVSFGDKEILSNITFQVQKGQCVGLTGLNGAGKTTLMKAISGVQEISAGSISISKGCRIGYLEQHHTVSSENTVFEEAKKSFTPLFDVEEKMHAVEEQMTLPDADLTALGDRYARLQAEHEALGGYGWKSRLLGVLKGLGLTEEFWDKPAGVLSGGEKTRLALAKMLLNNNDVLLLDEPTNHLDIEAAQWLTDFLSRSGATILLISHDRYMMDKLCDGVAQIENGSLRYYKGNYTEFCVKWEEELKANQKAYDKQQDEIKRQRAIIAKYRQFNREKSIRAAESREKVLDKMVLLEKHEDHADMRLNFQQNRVSGGDVLKIFSLSKGFENKILFENFSAEIKKGQKIAIIGPNGAGKTTLMEILMGLQRADRGEIIKGVNVDVGYYEQNHKEFMSNESVMDMVWRGNRDLTQTQVRTRCASMLFFGEDVFKEGSVLSGGERARVALCKLSLQGSNTLVLDEPTNHLDMDSREVLEDALERFDGTVIAVSHDRYFINRIFDILWIVKDGKIEVFSGSYDDYILSQKQEEEKQEATVNKTALAKERAKDRESREKEKKKRAKISELERKIASLEEEKAKMEELFSSAELYSDQDELKRAQEKYAQIEKDLDKAMEDWMELTE